MSILTAWLDISDMRLVCHFWRSACICTLFAIFSCASYSQEQETFRIGVALCQSGNCADWGTAALKGARLAQEQLNAAGGILARRIDFTVEDTAESISGARAVSAFQSLLARNVRFFIGPSWSPAASSLIPIVARRTDIIVITPSASARDFSRSARHVFNMRPPEELATRALAQHAIGQGKKRAAIFSSQQAAESTQGRIFEDEFKRLGGEITVRIEAIPTQSDLKAEALQIQRTAPDAIFLMNYNQMESGIKELNNLGYNGMRLAISLDEARVISARGLLEGMIVGRAAQPTDEFRSTFTNRFGEPPGLSAEGGYDAVLSLSQAVKQAGSFDSKAVQDTLQRGLYSGAIGAFHFDKNREVVQPPELLLVRAGRLELLSKR